MLTTIKNAFRRAGEQARQRREYELLLQKNSEQLYRDIGVQRSDIVRMYRNTRRF